MSQFLSTADAARILGVTPAAIRAMERAGRLPAAGRTRSGIRLFRHSDVQRAAKRRISRRDDRGR